MIQATEQMAESIGVSAACQALGMPRSSLYRARQASSKPASAPAPRPTPKRALSPQERAQVLQTLDSEPFQDHAPREVYATLLDEGIYLCHWRTMYRFLEAEDQLRERRNQLRHPTYTKPELLATAPRQVWSWDVTQLRGPAKWIHYYLYVILDIFSRYVPGWLIAQQESAQWAEILIAETCAKEGIQPNQLTLHSDRGKPMKSKSVAQLLIDLDVAKTQSRPYTPNDNPYSESQFKTLKYRPDYPDRFDGQTDAHAWARSFFQWYNHEHHHTGLGLLTPAIVHSGQASLVLAQRQQVLLAAYDAHPERFVRGMPKPPDLPDAVWINKPKTNGETTSQEVNTAEKDTH